MDVTRGHKRKKSVNFKDEPEILQTPPKTATFNKPIKSVLKVHNAPLGNELRDSQLRTYDDYMTHGSMTERSHQPEPLLPPFQARGLKDTFRLVQKKPIKNINIVESFNKSLNQAKSNVVIPKRPAFKLPEIRTKIPTENINVQRIYIGAGNRLKKTLQDTSGMLKNLFILM